MIVGNFASLAPAVTVDDFVARTYTNSAGRLPYRLFIPTNYNPGTKYPLVLFLHGAGERGSDNRYQLVGQTGPLVFAADANQRKNPSFMVAPQCPLDASWTDVTRRAQVLGMMNALMAEFSVDADRLYITGLSMGGYGTWDYIAQSPQMYAAAVPMNGGGNTALARRITRMPIWNFHAANDGTVPVSESRLIVQAVRRAGGNVIYTEYAGGGHGIWTPAYNTRILMDWVYAQKRGSFSAAPPWLGIVSPSEQPLYSLNATNLGLSGSATNGTNTVTAITWTNYSTGVASGLAQGTTNWSATNIVVNPAVTNLVLVVARGASWYVPFGGATTFNDTLAVIVPPSITSQPADLALNEGDTAAFSVLVPGYVSKPAYQWFYEGQPLAGATAPSLTLSNVHFAQAGTYVARITNAFGTLFSSNAVLEVNRLPVARCRPVVSSADDRCLAEGWINDGSLDPDGGPLVVRQLPEGPYPLGTNAVTLLVTDSKGASSACATLVVVLDRTPPQLVCPADITVTNAHEELTSTVAFAPAAADNCGSVQALTFDPPSGTAFGVGTHSVTCEAVDDAGNSTRCTFRVTVLPGNQPPVPAITVSPLALFPGWTNLIVIAPDGHAAVVEFDGAASFDPDDAAFHFAWSEGTNQFSTNAVAVRELKVGPHEITLTLEDTFPGGTSSTSVEVAVISGKDAVAILVSLVLDSGLSKKDQQPLLVTLKAAAAAFERNQFKAGCNQLGAFQNKVNAQVSPVDADLAAILDQTAQVIIDAFGK